MKEKFTIGIEEEFQIVDPVTRELRSHVSQMLDEGKIMLQEHIKPEMHKSVVEVGTGICANIKEARKSVLELRQGICQLATVKYDRAVFHVLSHVISPVKSQLKIPA